MWTLVFYHFLNEMIMDWMQNIVVFIIMQAYIMFMRINFSHMFIGRKFCII